MSTKAMTTGDVALMLGVSQSTVLRAAYTGKIKGFRTPGGHYRLDRESVARFKRDSRVRGRG